MAEYYVPAQDSETEFTEKRSRFIGHLWRVESEEEARERIAQTKAKYYDARHNCWCYLIREGGITRYSDDGEPQGTAGQPMLEVFRREGVENVCCVVTRYFGGVLLGTGGLLRAYTRSAQGCPGGSGGRCGPPVGANRRGVPLQLPGAGQGRDSRRPGYPGGDCIRRPRCASPPCCRWSTGRPMPPASQSVTGGKVAAEHLGETFQAAPMPPR